ncbi:hypothetical protein [Nitrospira sp. BLG_2]|uniref:hypothetical protein n=1 Tax=Nitrospira sp. BLG_2 TaxID=3397507 RepID=UPI003BA30DF3
MESETNCNCTYRGCNESLLFMKGIFNMAQNELNFGGRVVASEYVSAVNCPLPTTEDFYVYRMPRADKGVARGPRKEVKAVKVKAGKRGPGRPRVYDGTDRRIIAAALRKYGYTGGRKFLRKERKLKVSLTLCRQVAEAEGITFKRGRPAA